MTKEELRDYIPTKQELIQLEALARKLERNEDDDLAALYRVKRQELAERLRLIEEALETLGPTERTLMRLRYVEGLSWQAVSMRIHYSWKQTHRIHKNALRKLADDKRCTSCRYFVGCECFDGQVCEQYTADK